MGRVISIHLVPASIKASEDPTLQIMGRSVNLKVSVIKDISPFFPITDIEIL